MRVPNSFSDLRLATLLGAGVVCTRVPFLSTAIYGLDTDAARIAASGALWAEYGMYVPSRFPGYPLPELAAAGVWTVGGGPLLFSACSALLSGLAAAAFFLLLRSVDVERSRSVLGAVAALMVPVSFSASVQGMDYMWALAPALGALWAASRGRPVLGGLLLGLAISARLTAALFALPALVLLPRRSAAAILRAAGATFVVATALYAFPLHAFGLDLFWFNDGAPPLRLIVQHATLDVWGPLGLIALALGTLGLVASRRRETNRRAAWAFAAGALLVGIAYVRLPLEGGYLLPAVPFVVGLGALYLRQWVWRLVCALLIVSPFAFDLESVHYLPDGVHVVAEGPGPIRLLAEGPLLVDQARTRELADKVERALAVGDTLPEDTGLQIGSYLPDATMIAMRHTGQPPAAQLLYDAYPPRPWPERTADEVLMLRRTRPEPAIVLTLDPFLEN